jgi:hypothetical protein
MKVFSRICLVIFLLLAIAGCRSKKKPSLAGEDPVEVGDFIAFFPEAKLPFQFSDDDLQKKDKDSLLISYKVFTQFVPDSVLGKTFGQQAKPKIYPMARVGGQDTYLFSKVVAGGKRAVFVSAFDKKEKFVGAMLLLQPDSYVSTKQTAGIDSRYSLFRSIIRKNGDGSTSDGREVFILNNDARNFMLIMTEALDDKVLELINPIDTLSRKQKFTADYGSGKMNLVSIRDSRNNNKLQFFIHFEKNNGACIGELKGEAVMRTATTAEYREPGEPCSLQFTFSSSSVTIKELSGCGSKRGVRCSFNGVYPRKKDVKPKPKKTR